MPPRRDAHMEMINHSTSRNLNQHESTVAYTGYPTEYCEPPQDLCAAELIVTSTATTQQILVPSCSPTTMDSPQLSTVYDETNCLLNEAHDMSLAMNAHQTFDWCLNDNQYGLDGPSYSHDIYACPADLNDIDSVLNCDITDLDNYLHTPSTSAQPTSVNPPTQPIADPSSDDILSEFFPDLSSSQRKRNLSASTTSSTSVRGKPYDISEYRYRRDRNNEASKRSRAKRAEKLTQTKAECTELEKRNIELRTTLAALEVQVADYKRMVLMIVGAK